MPARLFSAFVVLAAAAAHPVAARDLTVVGRGEATQAALSEAYVRPFTEATKLDAAVGSWDGGIDALRTQLKSADNTWDLVMVDPDELAVGCPEGLFEKIEWSAVGGKDHYQPQGVSECGLGAVINNLVLAWDRDKFPVTPNWSDFWDVAKYPGRRGLGKTARGNLEIALLADGVAPGDVYKTLASADGVERAFRKLDQLKPYVVWWQTDAEAARILGSGDVLMTSASSGAIASASRQDSRNFGIQFAASLYELWSWAIAKASPNLRSAQQFLYFSGIPAVEGRLLRLTGQVGVARGLNDSLPPELLAISPTSQANLSAAMRFDVAFWHENDAKLRQRFEAWVGR